MPHAVLALASDIFKPQAISGCSRATGLSGVTARGSFQGHCDGLWTGDLGFAVRLWHCIRGEAQFPTLDVF